MSKPFTATNEQLARLIAFRQAAYRCLGNARDALFELGDAVLVTPAANSFVELSCAPVFRRRWSSLYEALQDGRPDRPALLRLYAEQMKTSQRPILAGDHTAWPRVTAYTLPERTIEHQPTKVPGNRPITVGMGFSTLVWVPERQGSWALPLLHERIASTETAIEKASDQLRRVCQVLPQRSISLWDAEYGCASFILKTADIPADKIVRLRPNLCLWGPPPPYRGRYRPPEHGAKFKLNDPTTWGPPAETLTVTDPQLGEVELSLWHNLHFRKAKAHPMTVVRVHRPQARATRRDPKDLWIAWIGQEPLPLATGWSWYLRRFAVDHWYRFSKQSLYWTLPQLATPDQAQRWSDLVTVITWQLWLAREIVADNPRPWQNPNPSLALDGSARGWPPFWPRLVHRPKRPNPAERALVGRKGALVSGANAFLWSKRPRKSLTNPADCLIWSVVNKQTRSSALPSRW